MSRFLRMMKRAQTRNKCFECKAPLLRLAVECQKGKMSKRYRLRNIPLSISENLEIEEARFIFYGDSMIKFCFFWFGKWNDECWLSLSSRKLWICCLTNMNFVSSLISISYQSSLRVVKKKAWIVQISSCRSGQISLPSLFLVSGRFHGRMCFSPFFFLSVFFLSTFLLRNSFNSCCQIGYRHTILT